MSRARKRSKIVPLMSIVIVSFGACPAYYFGQPWIRFHQENVVVYDCRLNSDSIPVGSMYSGRIKELHVTVGQSIEPGDVIAVLDTMEIDAEIVKATAAIELAEAGLAAEQLAIERAVDAMIAQQQCLEARLSVSETRSDAVRLETGWIEKELERSSQLARRGSVPNSEIDELLRELQNFRSKEAIADEEVEVADADLIALDARTNEIRARFAGLDVFKKKIEIAKLELAAATLRRDASVIYAEESGTVIEVLRGVGSSLLVGDPIIRVQARDIWSEIRIDESQLADVSCGMPVTISLKAYPDLQLKGRITGFLPVASSTVREPAQVSNPVLQSDAKISLKVELAPAEPHLVPGLTGMAVISRSARSQNEITAHAGD
ncbi:MAG: efflux RND transporter periplasmic adaptor subunit [Planctomycetota bacterium]